MSRFHFDENVMENTVSWLKTVNQNIENNLLVLRNAGSDIRKEQGYGINAIYSKLSAENQKLIEFCNILGTGIAETENITEIVNRYAKSANGTGSSFVDRVNKILSDERTAINSVLHGDKDDDENGGVCPPNHGTAEVEQNNAASSYNQATDQRTGKSEWFTREDGKLEKPINNNTHVIVDAETGGHDYYLLAPAYDLFGRWNSGFVQSRRDGDPYGWFQSDYQCVATAQATTSVYNGADAKTSTPHAFYSGSDYWLGYSGEAANCQWSGYGKLSVEEFMSYIKGNLGNGKATTIYAHKNNNYETGHAVTVVGYTNGGNAIDDLLVVDPWSGHTYRLGDFLNGNNGYNGYYSIDYSS